MRAVDVTDDREESYYLASQWQLMRRKFRRHKLANFGGIILIVLYTLAAFCDFIAPYEVDHRFSGNRYCPPQSVHFFAKDGFHLRPFVYALKQEIDEKTWQKIYTEDKTKPQPVRFFVHGDSYRFLGLLQTDIHLFGVEDGSILLFGTDELGRDLFSRTLWAARISLFLGLVGVSLSFILGIVIGGISGYFGGNFDIVIQRIIEFLISIPTVPLWMALSAALPAAWSPIKVFFGISIILSFVGWCGIARVVRGKFLELREEDFVTAARLAGAKNSTIIFGHLVPSFMSYLIVQLTLAIPGMILGETALSYLGLGIRPPAVSWGALLKSAQNVSTISLYPWLLIPAIFVVATVLGFNFLGDGLRDAADPYK